MLPFSRKHESEADYMGLILMTMAGYNPHAAVTFWEKMSMNGQTAVPEFMSSHPSDATRISNIKKHLADVQKYRPATHPTSTKTTATRKDYGEICSDEEKVVFFVNSDSQPIDKRQASLLEHSSMTLGEAISFGEGARICERRSSLHYFPLYKDEIELPRLLNVYQHESLPHIEPDPLSADKKSVYEERKSDVCFHSILL